LTLVYFNSPVPHFGFARKVRGFFILRRHSTPIYGLSCVLVVLVHQSLFNHESRLKAHNRTVMDSNHSRTVKSKHSISMKI
jgi:hypothetical protein